jgi:TetR/AcrR family transcriptional regulator, mexJK operon transcriptional repressor
LMSPHMMLFEQRFSADMVSMPEIAARFFAAGPGQVHQRLAALLTSAGQENKLKIDDADLAAKDLIGLWQGFTPVEVKFGVASPPSALEIRRKVLRGVQVFLRAYGNT